MSTYQIAAAGETALKIIQEERNAFVIGLTSRGVFCFTGNGQVFFLSYEDWRGPLTVNLYLGGELENRSRYLTKAERSHPQPFDRLIHGSAAELFPGRIRFADEDINIVNPGISAWKAEIRPLQKTGLEDARACLERVARKVLAEESGKGWIGTIPRWAGFDIHLKKDDGLKEVEDGLQHLAEGFRARNCEEILVQTARLLGRGTGLTPSGDDFIIGLLLGLRTTNEISPAWSLVNELSDRLLLQARQKTTTLAANLITCALEGQADERLVTALDGILWGSLPAAECARRLNNYGGSSGGDTLLGIAMALSLI